MWSVVEVIVLAAHLWAMNIATAGPFLALILHLRERRDPTLQGAWAQRLVTISLVAFTVGMALGGGVVLAAWGHRADALMAGVSSIPTGRFTYGVAELAFYALCLLGYRAAVQPGVALVSRRRAGLGWLLALLAGTNLAYHFPPLFAMLGTFTTRREVWGTVVPFTQALVDPEIVALTVHFLLASVAVTGVTFAWQAARPHPTVSEPERRWAVAWGVRAALAATVLQLVSGLALLATLTDLALDALLGGSALASGCLALGIVASVLLLHQLAGAAWGEPTSGELRQLVATLALTVLIMCGALESMRATLRPVGVQANSTSVDQDG